MAELRMRKRNSQHCATLWQGNLHKVAAPYFLLFMYMVHLYKEDWTILPKLGCRAVALPSTEQIGDIKYPWRVWGCTLPQVLPQQDLMIICIIGVPL